MILPVRCLSRISSRLHEFCSSGKITDFHDLISPADVCEDYCENGGKCEIPQNAVEPRCVCHSNFYGERCERKSDFVYVAGGIAAAVVFLIVMVLLIWMICVRYVPLHVERYA